jgi:hypothetical protein
MKIGLGIFFFGLLQLVAVGVIDSLNPWAMIRTPLRYRLSNWSFVEALICIGEALTSGLRFARLASRTEAINVTADVKDIDVQSPDPAEKVFASEDLLDANPGRPCAPISIHGYQIETASSGIKAPQYFAPGVAGDYGEPIAQYLQVGIYWCLTTCQQTRGIAELVQGAR